MNISQRRNCAFPSARRQRGVALVVALVLLLVITLMGLASMRGTSLQERMSANMYDRSLAFQRAEAALRGAETAITSNWQIAALGGEDCSNPLAAACRLVPANTFAAVTGPAWTNVTSVHNVNEDLTPGTPQYLIQFMGTGLAPSNYGLDANADFDNYGNAYPPDNVAYYRVTARSSSPADAGERSVVVLQSTVKRAY
jgi:type IV pilus assembly protein PilX